MLAQRFARLFSKAVDRVQNPRRQAGLFGDLHQQARGQRRGFGRFVHHGTTRGQCRRNLPCRQHERGVPRRDDTNRSNRRARRDVHQGRGWQVLTVPCGCHLIGKVAEVFSPAQRRFGHEFVGLAGVPTFTQSDLIGSRLDPFCDADQNGLALFCRHITPGRKRGLGSFGRTVDITRVRTRNGANMRGIHRRYIVEGAERSGGVLTVNPVGDAAGREAFEVAVQFRDVLVCNRHSG